MRDVCDENPLQRRAIRVGRLVLALCCACCVAACARPPSGGEVGTEVGQFAPDFELEDLGGGEAIRLSDYRGQVVLIHFWAVWCGSCRIEFPEIERAYTRNRDQGFVVLAINVQDRRDRVEAYVQELGLSVPVLLDPLGRASGRYQTRRLPASYFVDADGRVVRRQIGPLDEALIARVLDEARMR